MITLTKFDRRILFLNRILIGFLVLVTLSPLLYVLIASFMDPFILRSQGLSLNPANWSVEGYKRVLQDPAIVRGFLNSIFYSTAYSALTVGVSILTAYPLSKKKLIVKRPITIFLIITMFLGGGLVPTYFVGEKLGHAEYGLGNHPTRIDQYLEHHPGADVLSTTAYRAGRGCHHRWRQ